MCLIVFLAFNACGSSGGTESEDYGNLVESPSGLALTEGEHQAGWGKAECTICHNLNNIHMGESEEGYDMAAVRAQVSEEGLSSCATCHGTNGR